jgi:hypothetical protein
MAVGREEKLEIALARERNDACREKLSAQMVRRISRPAL